MRCDFEFYVALLSLVDAEGNPLEDFIGKHLAWLKENGADGVLVMGTTGEFSGFSVGQRRLYLDIVLANNPGLNVMVNIGASAMADVQALQEHALSRSGVGALLWMPPFYYPDSAVNGLVDLIQTGLRHQPADIPLYLYHYPKMSQVSITPEILERFPQLAGIKDTSGDFERIGRLVQQFPQMRIFVGTDYQVSQSKALGCAGIISGMGNIFPQRLKAAIQGDVAQEAVLHGVREALPENAKMPGLKAVLNHLNLSSQKAVSMLPFRDLSPEDARKLLETIENLTEKPYVNAC